MARSKKDIDRELMYKKILPTATAGESPFDKAEQDEKTEELPASRAVDATLEINIQKPVEIIFSPQSGDMAPPENPQGQNPEEMPLRASEPAPPESWAEALQPESQAPLFTEAPLVNLMEAFVEKRLDAAFKKFKCCSCERCRKDVLAIALNKLPPLYVIEDDPDMRDLHERERSAQVATALVQAILTVKSRPLHEPNR